MRLSRDSAFAVFAVTHMATRTQQHPPSAEDLAESCGIPGESLATILPKLAKANVLRAETGPLDRYSLTRAPQEITLLDIVEAIEGQTDPGLLLPRCTRSPAAAPADAEQAATGRHAWEDPSAWTPVRGLLARLLSTKTIADLIGGSDRPAQ